MENIMNWQEKCPVSSKVLITAVCIYISYNLGYAIGKFVYFLLN